MNQYFLEFIWLDGAESQQVRSKTKIAFAKSPDKINWKSKWNYDGSSTGQAETSKSELILVPVSKYKDPFRENGYLVMCEVYNVDMTPHYSNKRHDLYGMVKDNGLSDDCMFGFEQEYIIYDRGTSRPLGWPKDGFPRPQGDYYCGVGGDNVSGRKFAEEHASLCLSAGLKYSGTNAEVMLGQWEYQIGPVYAIDGSDQLWVSRWILQRLSESYNYSIEFHPKPFIGNDWNGSGMHVNFSTLEMREDLSNKRRLAIEACERLGKNIEAHISVYGAHNDLRLTGANETCSIREFRWGIGDRTASIRIPSTIEDDSTPGYIEDRRPASNANPYEICYQLISTIKFSGSVPKNGQMAYAL